MLFPQPALTVHENGVYSIGEGCDGEDGGGEGVKRESSDEEMQRKAAYKKYEQFQKECGHLLDPALSVEFTLMASLGLPTMLINSYGDMESEVRGGRGRRGGEVGEGWERGEGGRVHRHS